MRPLVLKGHERSITSLMYNREGDLLFTTSKDKFPTVWNAETGERLGTYNGHTGSVWHLDVSFDSKYLLTGAADMSARLWEVETGELLATYMHERPVRCVNFQHGLVMAGQPRHFISVSDQVMGQTPKILVYRLPKAPPSERERATAFSKTPVMVITGWSTTTRVTNAAWGPENETIICTGEDGKIVVYNAETGKELQRVDAHAKSIRDLKFDSPQQLYFMTGSVDTTAKLWDTRTLKCLKTFDTGRSINCCSISPAAEHVLLAGGQEAVDVALTRVDPAQFHVRIWHRALAAELGQVGGHFGPVNTLSYSPDGRSFASGGEDGYVRVHHLDDSYFVALGDDKIEELLS